MRKISIVIPCFNEEKNVRPISDAIVAVFTHTLKEYDYEIIFIDNCSTDQTRTIIKEICQENPKIKAIFNTRNFGQFNSPFYGLLQGSGDATIIMACDFQDPVEMIEQFVREWEKGYQIVVGVKTKSDENKIVYALRSLYYKMIQKFSNVEMIRHFTGFGLYDKAFIQLIASLEDPMPFLRGIVAEFGYNIKQIPFDQPKRLEGKTHNNFSTLYDAAMLSFTSYTTLGLRAVTITGFIVGVLSFLIGFIYLIYKLIHWYDFHAGTAPILIGVFFLGSIILFTLGLIGEYVIAINRRLMNRPLVIEEERINFEDSPNA